MLSNQTLQPPPPFAFNLSQHQRPFPMSQLFAQSIGASASVLPMNIQGWFPFDWFNLLAVRVTEASSPAPQFNINSLALSLLYVQLSHLYMATEKVIALTIYFTHDSVAMSILISQFIPPSQVHSLHQFLYSLPGNRFFVTICLDSTYILSFWLSFTLYVRFKVQPHLYKWSNFIPFLTEYQQDSLRLPPEQS